MKELLFSELRMLPVTPVRETLAEQDLVTAMTANEELLQLGYVLAPKDVILLSRSAELPDFPALVRRMIGEVKAKPMYPDFPAEVMQMDEAVFRFHQLLHYLSTYGVEELTGAKVTRGWLPETEDTPKTETDTRLLDAKVLQLMDAAEMYALPFRRILSRTERMTDKERAIILGCIPHLTAEEMSRVRVTFKQNLLDVFHAVFTDAALTGEQKLDALHALCQHTGDVWKCMDYTLVQEGFHFRTSQKRLMVRLLERYPAADFRANLILSSKKAERTVLMLRYLDYKVYARSPEQITAVAELRSGKLRSWESRAKYLVRERHPEALEFIAERPGMMLRMLTFLLRSGYTAAELQAHLVPHAAELRTQTVCDLLRHFGKTEENWELPERYAEAQEVYAMCEPLLRKRLAALTTPLQGKRVYVSMQEYDLAASELRTNDKSAEGGYIRSGIAYRIPEAAKRIRFFVYWNDEERVDVDLHAAAYMPDGSQFNVGWNQHYVGKSLAFSGDITHSDAAEYVDVDLTTGEVDAVTVNLNLYSGRNSFGEIETCFVGCMAVDSIGREIKLYDPANCFFTHRLTTKASTMQYGYVDAKRRAICFVGEKVEEWYGAFSRRETAFSLQVYLRLLFAAQNVQEVFSPDEADAVLVMGKPAGEKEISLIDNNFFLESAQE